MNRQATSAHCLRGGIRLSVLTALFLLALGLAQTVFDLTPEQIKRLAEDVRSGYAKQAPWQNIRWDANVTEVYLDGSWYTLVSIENLSEADLVDFAKTVYQDDWQKRLAEDLVAVLTQLERPPGQTVLLVLETADGTQLSLDTPMTEANRADIKRVHEEVEEVRPARLSSQALQEDLDVFEQALVARFAYLEANGANYHAALSEIRQKLTGVDSASVNNFALDLQKIIALFIDGHAGVSAETLEGFTPFLVEPVAERYVAFEPNRKHFLDAEHPYLTHIDERPLAEWLGAASTFVARGSPQYVERHSLRLLRNIQLLRSELGLPLSDTLSLTLTDENAQSQVMQTLPVAQDSPVYGTWPRNSSGLLDGNIGYLRLERMDENAVAEVHRQMQQFADTDGLIVDVRGNGGGSRDALLAFFPYLMRPNDPPHVANVATYRRFDDFAEDHLDARYMYRADWSGWTEDEQRAIEAFRPDFSPEWTPPEDKFHDWHYLVLSDSEQSYFYDKSAVVLSDPKAFSATDIFLGALQGQSNVTLMGEPSGGGSARSQSFKLPNSGLSVRLASMASFQPSGELYDGNGVQPDIVVTQTPEFFIGGRDATLERALEFLQR